MEMNENKIGTILVDCAVALRRQSEVKFGGLTPGLRANSA
jgi:hypothetical protein